VTDQKTFINEAGTVHIAISTEKLYDHDTGKIVHGLQVIASLRADSRDIWGPPIILREET